MQFHEMHVCAECRMKFLGFGRGREKVAPLEAGNKKFVLSVLIEFHKFWAMDQFWIKVLRKFSGESGESVQSDNDGLYVWIKETKVYLPKYELDREMALGEEVMLPYVRSCLGVNAATVRTRTLQASIAVDSRESRILTLLFLYHTHANMVCPQPRSFAIDNVLSAYTIFLNSTSFFRRGLIILAVPDFTMRGVLN